MIAIGIPLKGNNSSARISLYCQFQYTSYLWASFSPYLGWWKRGTEATRKRKREKLPSVYKSEYTLINNLLRFGKGKISKIKQTLFHNKDIYRAAESQTSSHKTILLGTWAGRCMEEWRASSRPKGWWPALYLFTEVFSNSKIGKSPPCPWGYLRPPPPLGGQLMSN